MTLDDYEFKIRCIRIDIRNNEAAGLCPLAEHHLELALASLDAAQAQIDLAKVYQARELAGR